MNMPTHFILEKFVLTAINMATVRTVEVTSGTFNAVGSYANGNCV